MICPKCGREAFGTVCSNCKTPLYDAMAEPIEQEYPERQERWDEERPEPPYRRPRGSQETERDERQERYGEQSQGRTQEQHQEQKQRKSNHAKKDAAPKAASKGEQKEKKLLEKRIRTLETERQQRQKTERQQERTELRRADQDQLSKNRRQQDHYISDQENETENRSRTRSRRRGGDSRKDSGTQERRTSEYRESSSGSTLADAAFKGVTGAVVLTSRVMQIICVLLMACMVWVTARSFLSHSMGLGNIETMITDRNYGLALYVGVAAVTLLMGVIWCLWTASRKAAGGNIRLKKYDTGRGFIPFILCAAAIFGARSAAALIPADPAAWQGLAAGAGAALAAINANHTLLVSCSVIGIILSLVRKLLRV